MDELIAFIRARLAEEQTAAYATAYTNPNQVRSLSWRVSQRKRPAIVGRECMVVRNPGDPMVADSFTHADAEHIALQDPEKTLDGIRSTQMIVDLIEKWINDPHRGVVYQIGPATIRLMLCELARKYQHRCDYRPEWNPCDVNGSTT